VAFGRHPGARRAAPLPLLLFACAGVIGLPAVGWGQFSAHPVVVDFEAGADTARTAITVRNHGRAPLQFRVYVGDFEQESDGSHRFLDAGAHPSSCAARLRAYPSELVIDPGQTRPVVAEMAPGSGTCWSVVWIETMAEAGGAQRIPGGKSRWSQGKDLSWEPLRPELVVQVAYDHMQGTRFRHTAQFRRFRSDKPPRECTYEQLEVVAPEELAAIFGAKPAQGGA